ncbi:MAG: iron-containing alcohol dehydrogenase [Armatimonadota bacterium]
MQSFDFFNSVRLLFGTGQLQRLGDCAAQYGRRAMLVTGRSSARETGVLDRAMHRLDEAGVEVTLFDRVMPNPTDEIVEEGGELAREVGADVVIGLGGGSPMDAAKGIAVAATDDRPVSEFLTPPDKAQPTDATLPLICVTTTSGTSSELTPYAVITVRDLTMKSSIGGDHIYPRVAIVDPELTLTCPPSVTANTGADVLAHAMEGYFSTVASPITEVCSERAIGLVGRHLPRAVSAPDDLSAREGMSLANVFAGYTLSNCGATVLHALEHPMSAHYPELPHGAGLAVLMVAYAERYWEEAPHKFGRITQLLGDAPQVAPEHVADGAADAIRSLLERIGLNVGLEDIGVERELLPTIADDAMHYMGGAITKTPVELSREDLIELLEASYSRD